MRKEEEMHPNSDQKNEQATLRHHNYLKPKGSYSPPAQTEVQLFARIKKSSQYYHQGLDHNGTPRIFKVEGIRQGFLCFRLGDNNYSTRDLAFYVRDAQGDLIPLSGGMENG